jgi:hypothetical protein
MFFARKRTSTTDERSLGIDTLDPFAASEVPVAGAILNPQVAPLTRTLANAAVATLDTNSIGYGSFGGQDLTDHFRFNATPGKTYTLVVSTDSSNGNIRTDAFADYFDLYFEDANGVRLTADFQVKDLDLRTKLVEFTVPGTGTTAVPLYVQVDNALQKPFEYAIALFDKAAAPRIGVQATEQAAGRFLVTFTSDQVLVNSRPRVDRIEVEGGTLSTLVRSADGKFYTATFTPSADSKLAPRVKALSGSFFNVAGDPNLDGDDANNGASLAPDKTPPAVAQMTLVGPGLGMPAALTVPYTLSITFTEAVEAFDLTDVSIEGGVATRVQRVDASGGTVWEVQVERTGNSRSISATVKAGGYNDLSPSKNKSVAPATVSFFPDLDSPEASLRSAKVELQPGERATVILTFTERVLGLDESKLGVEGGTLIKGSLRAVDSTGQRYAFDVEADADEVGTPDVTVLLLDSERITDAQGNPVLPPMTLTLFGALFYLTAPATADEFGVTLNTVNRTEGATFTLNLLTGQPGEEPIELGVGTSLPEGSTVPLPAQATVVSGDVVAHAGGVHRAAGLRLTLGTDGDDELVATTGEHPLALFGFDGRDVLREAGEGPLTLVGGTGVDLYELSVGAGEGVTVIEGGSPLVSGLGASLNATGALPVLGDIFAGFDLVLGFNAADGADTLRFLRAEDTPLMKVRGVYDPSTGTFSVDASGFDVMLFTDEPGGRKGRPDVGENAVVVVGVAAVMGG